jgi:hypothetical protein
MARNGLPSRREPVICSAALPEHGCHFLPRRQIPRADPIERGFEHSIFLTELFREHSVGP